MVQPLGGTQTLIDFASGSIGGIALVYVGQPFDTIKVKMQTYPKIYTGMVHCFKTTLLKDGIYRGLYAGTIPALIANITENSVLFAGYGFAQNCIMKLTNKTKDQLNILNNAMAGFFGGMAATVLLCPTELIKCRLQALRETQKINPEQRPKKIGPFGLTKQIIRTEGTRGMFRGLTATFYREMFGYFFFFGAYEAARGRLRKPGQTKEQIGPFKTMAAGAIGGIFFWLAIFPVDVIKSRTQITGVTGGFLNAAVKIVKIEGVSALYHGLLPTLLRTVPGTATLFLTVEYSKKLLTAAFVDKKHL